ncbi:glycosyltransferase [Candidatus Nomurabacteria bacterium]|nr:glycosyltransferase [Candidatus Nomurabacteria bacterium]
MLKGRSLAFILPLYNARHVLHDTFAHLKSFVQNSNVEVKLIFVDDGSSDGSFTLLQEFVREMPGNVVVLQNDHNRGKGYSIQKGLSACQGIDYVGFTDIDLPYTLDPVMLALTMMQEHGKDAVIGDRSLLEVKQYSLYRKACTSVFRILVPTLLKEFPDTQSGIKFFTADAARHAFSKLLTHKWVFDIELLLALREGGYTIGRIPVKLSSVDSTWGGVSFVRHGWGIVKDLLVIHRGMRKGHYTSRHRNK